MDCGACNDLVAAIQRHFAYLFEAGFRLVYCDEARGGEYCLVGLENGQARFKVELEQGTPAAYLGTLDSPFQWGDRVDDVQVWYSVNQVLNALEGKLPATLAEMFPRGGPARPADEVLAAEAARLQPRLAEVLAGFGPEAPVEWWQAFEAYQAELSRRLSQALGPR